jgi:hypothetical protein
MSTVQTMKPVNPEEVKQRFIQRDAEDQQAFEQLVNSDASQEQAALIALLNNRVKNLCAMLVYTLDYLETNVESQS